MPCALSCFAQRTRSVQRQTHPSLHSYHRPSTGCEPRLTQLAFKLYTASDSSAKYTPTGCVTVAAVIFSVMGTSVNTAQSSRETSRNKSFRQRHPSRLTLWCPILLNLLSPASPYQCMNLHSMIHWEQFFNNQVSIRTSYDTFRRK